MGNLIKASYVIAILASPIPVSAQGTTTAFDGTYSGVSYVMGSSQTDVLCRLPPPPPVPGQLTIANGVAQTPGGLQGTVNAQGVLVMHNKIGQRYDGQIDTQGVVRVRLSLPVCYFDLTWQRR